MNFLLITIVLITCAFIYLKLAERFNIVDNPNFRSSHSTPTIRGGGILFFIAVLLYFFTSNFQYPFFIMGISIISMVSFLDDIITLSAKFRLPFQFVAVGLILYQLQLFDVNLFLIALVCIVGVGFINIFNFMDGINGITGIYSITVLGSFLGLNYFEPLIDSNLIIYVLISLFVFGFYNFRSKARMFAGDIGSISLAVLILLLVLLFTIYLKSPLILLFVVVYGIDGGLTILYRISLGEHIMEPHRHHIYQKLVDIDKWSHLKVSMMYALVQLLVNFFVFYFYNSSIVQQVLIILAIIAILCLLYYFLFKKLELNCEKNI